MKIKWPKSIKTRLKEMREPILEQMEIEQAFQTKLRTTMVTSKNEEEIKKARESFDDSVDRWEVLNKALKEYNTLAEKKWKFSPDTLLVVAGNLVGILLILNFERLDIVRSKAISFVLKGRV